jgi:hypothetical protein
MRTSRARSRYPISLLLGLASGSVACGAEPSGPALPPISGQPPDDCQGSLQVVASGRRGGTGMALDGSFIYLKTAGGTFSVPKTGGTLAAFPGVPPAFPRADVVSDGTFEYRLEAERLARFAPDGTSAELAAAGDVQSECFSLTLRLGVLYWTGADGSLRSVATGGGTPRVLAQAGGSDCDDDYEGLAVAADDSGIYWIAGDPGQRNSDEQELKLYRACR